MNRIFKQISVLGCLIAMPAFAAEPIQAVVAQEREVAQTYSIDGVVEAARQATLSAQISGRVKAVMFDVGDRVTKGQIILKIDESEADQALAGSSAQLSQAQAALTNAKANYERSQQLFTQKFISQATLDKAKTDYEMAEAQAKASEAGAQQSALARSYTSVAAPYSGVVSARMVEMGEMVTVGKPLMTGFDPSELRIITNVPQHKLSEIGSAPIASVEVPEIHRWLKVASVSVQPSADPRTHSTQVRVNLSANEKGVYPGMFVRTHFVVGKISKLLIPLSSVLRRSEVVAVYVVDDKGLPRLRQVRLGEVTDKNEVEIIAGLRAGERVATDPVKAGMAVSK